jgi:hypothetical protein
LVVVFAVAVVVDFAFVVVVDLQINGLDTDMHCITSSLNGRLLLKGEIVTQILKGFAASNGFWSNLQRVFSRIWTS